MQYTLASEQETNLKTAISGIKRNVESILKEMELNQVSLSGETTQGLTQKMGELERRNDSFLQAPTPNNLRLLEETTQQFCVYFQRIIPEMHIAFAGLLAEGDADEIDSKRHSYMSPIAAVKGYCDKIKGVTGSLHSTGLSTSPSIP